MKRDKRKTRLIFSIIFLLFLIFIETYLRKIYGFTDAILVREDKNFEYISIPQKRHRFGNTNTYNSFSQRSREPSANDSIIVLGFGDSVLNGGALLEQDSIATTMLTEFLTEKYKKQALFINVSAGSWGPDNCYAYLRKYGNFNAKRILLVVSSHDAYDNMNFEKVVGKNPDFPDKQYSLAIAEVFDRYIYPRYIKKYLTSESDVPSKNDGLNINKYRPGTKFNSGFHNFKMYSDSTHIPLLIYLHADQQELEAKKYNQQGKEIINFCKQNNIPLIEELNYKFLEKDYRDGIHLSTAGQRHMFDVLKLYY